MPVTESITQFASNIQPDDTIDDFLDKLEVLLDCKDAGYTECFNRVKDLVNTKTNKELHGYKKGYERVKKQKETLLKLYEEQRAINRRMYDAHREEKKILENYRVEMCNIEKYTDDEVEDIVDVKPYIEKLTAELEKVRNKGLEYKNKWCETINLDVEISNEKAKNKKLTQEIEELKASLTFAQESQISCDCMVGGECEGEDNCANGMRILKLTEENEKLKAKHSSMLIHDRDKRITPITMKMSYGYVRDWIEESMIGEEIADEWWDTDKCDDVMEDVAQAIENEINAYITAYEHNDLKQIVSDRINDDLTKIMNDDEDKILTETC